MGNCDERILANLVRNKSVETPDLDVLTFVSIDKDGHFCEQIRTYSILWQQGQKMAQGLVNEGVKPGDRFAILAQNDPEFVDAMVASSIVGSVFVPIDPRAKGDKLVHMLTFADCKGVICSDYALQQLLGVVDRIPTLEWIWVFGEGGAGSLLADQVPGICKRIEAALPASAPDLPVAVTNPEQNMQLLYTSGTTGEPKAIEASYLRFHGVGTLGVAIGLAPDDRPYTGLSLTHANAQLVTVGNTLYMGLRGVISQKFTKSRLWDICRHYGCTVFNLLGGMTTAIYSEAEKPDDGDNPVRYLLSAGMPATLWNKFSRRFGVDIFEFYGAAEGGFTFNPPGAGPIGSVGKPPASLKLRVIDEAGNDCGPGESGEIVFMNADGSSPVVNYFKNPEASAKKTADGMLHTGDLGYMDENGWVFFECRMGSSIRRNGDFISPAEIEKVIAELPSIDDVFVYGITAANGAVGEKDIIAVVVASDAAPFCEQDVFKRCRQQLAANAVPTYIQLIDEIPKTASEKPQERFCLEHFKAHPDNVFTEKNS